MRVGYYVNNEYDSDELNAEPPAKPIVERVRRNILAEKPRVTRFTIKWYVVSLQFKRDLEQVWPKRFSIWDLKQASAKKSPLLCTPNADDDQNRDSEDSAPPEFPPDQPEADNALDDGTNYGAEEVELEEALKADLQKTEAELAAGPADTDGDAAMGGVEAPAGAPAEADGDEESDAGSEDLEAESSGSDDEDEEEAEGDGDEDMDMGEDTPAAGKENQMEKGGQEVMVH